MHEPLCHVEGAVLQGLLAAGDTYRSSSSNGRQFPHWLYMPDEGQQRVLLLPDEFLCV
jgi:hypothetical protein